MLKFWSKTTSGGKKMCDLQFNTMCWMKSTAMTPCFRITVRHWRRSGHEYKKEPRSKNWSMDQKRVYSTFLLSLHSSFSLLLKIMMTSLCQRWVGHCCRGLYLRKCPIDLQTNLKQEFSTEVPFSHMTLASV